MDVRYLPARAKIVVLATLDGSRFDPYFDVSGATARMFLPLIREQVPVVFFSSRTRAELEVIQQQLGIRHPFVVENGGALYVPRGYFGFEVPRSRIVGDYDAVSYGRPYADVVAALRLTADQLDIAVVGFNDMSVRDVAVDCGLSLCQAQLAKRREYGEPFRVTATTREGTARDRLTRELGRARMRCLDTGRYTHVGADVDQGAIVDLLVTLYRRAFKPALTVGIGDPVADLTLIQRVDIPLSGTACRTRLSSAAKPPSAITTPVERRTGALLDTLHASSSAWWRDVYH